MKVSAKLQSIIDARPLKTYLRSDSEKYSKQYEKILKTTDMPRNIKIPNSFDGREVWDGLLSPVKNQGSCSACWAFATVSSLADRFNIISMGLMHVDLSATKLILCDEMGKEFDIVHPEVDIEQEAELEERILSKGACFGNTLYDAWRYLYTLGTNTTKCVPYSDRYGKFAEFTSLKDFSDVYRMPTCSVVTGPLGDMCSDFLYNPYNSEEIGTPARFYRALHFYGTAGVPKDGGTELNIRYTLYCWGPVTASMKIYPDFYTFNSKQDIYEWNGIGPSISGHAVSIIGWGEIKGKKYWIIRNSWGVDWGDNGFFKMVRGSNNCELEENVISGVPDFFYPETHKTTILTKNPEWGESLKSMQQRKQVDNDLSFTAGGIDPETGYSRRVMTVMPWIDFTRPVKLSDLPDLTTSKWIAGVDASVNPKTMYQSIVRTKNQREKINDGVIYIVIAMLSILVIVMVVVPFIITNKI